MADNTLKQIRKDRIKKIEALKRAGLLAYPIESIDKKLDSFLGGIIIMSEEEICEIDFTYFDRTSNYAAKAAIR